MNEYHESFQELRERETFRGEQWFGKRSELVEEYSWAVPNEEVLVYLAEFDHLYEIGAGSGYWAKCISDKGGTVTPIDADPPDEQYATVVRAYADEYAEKISDSPVLMVWPPYDERMASYVANCGPSHICYVGEQRGGCTGDEGFFDTLDKKYGLVAKIDIPSYEGIHDNFFHYVRKL